MIDFVIWGGFGVFALGMYFLSRKFGKKEGVVDRDESQYEDYRPPNADSSDSNDADDNSDDDSGSDDSGGDDD